MFSQAEHLEELLDTERPVLEKLAPTSPSIILDVFPIIRFLPIKLVQDLFKSARDIIDWLKRKEVEMKQHADMKNPSCMYEELLQYQMKTLNTEFSISDEKIRGICGNTVFAGFATTSTTIHTLVGILANRFDIQEKLHAEIAFVLGQRRPSLADRHNMPYMEFTH